MDDLIKTALTEDINYIDTTTDLMIPETARTKARFVAKADGVLCGLEVALRVFRLLDDTVQVTVHIPEGADVHKGDLIAEFEGYTRALLKGAEYCISCQCRDA